MTSTSFFSLALLFFALQASPALASVATNWTNPSAYLPSFSSTFLVGERILLSWLALNDSTDDLWLTRYDNNVDTFSLRIASEVDVSVDGSFAWTIALSSLEVLKDTRFDFQFVPTGSTYDAAAEPQLESPAFNIMLVNQSTPPNGTVAATSSSAPATATSSSAPDATSVPAKNSTISSVPPPPTNNHSHFSTGAIAATAIGVLALIAFAGFGAGFWTFRKRRARHNTNITLGSSDSAPTTTGPYEILGDRKQPVEINSKELREYEMKYPKETDVHESLSSPIHEVGNTLKRPGLHEMPG